MTRWCRPKVADRNDPAESWRIAVESAAYLPVLRVPPGGIPRLSDEPLRRGYRQHPSIARYTRGAVALTLLDTRVQLARLSPTTALESEIKRFGVHSTDCVRAAASSAARPSTNGYPGGRPISGCTAPAPGVRHAAR